MKHRIFFWSALVLSALALLVAAFFTMVAPSFLAAKNAGIRVYKNNYNLPNALYPSELGSEFVNVDGNEKYFEHLTGVIEDVEPLLQSIRKEAPSMEILPLDLVVDFNTFVESLAKTDGKITVSYVESPKLIETRAGNPKDMDEVAAMFRVQGLPPRTEPFFLCVDAKTDEFVFADFETNLFVVNHFLNRRYDITYDRFLPFFRFYSSAVNATAEEIDECFAAFDDMTPKEKALALTALYVFEERARKPSPQNRGLYERAKRKYADDATDDPFTSEKWSSLLAKLQESAENDEIAFEAIPNEGIIEEWERSLRSHALLYQRQLASFNPIFVPSAYSPREGLGNMGATWYRLCRLAPIEFLYGLLLSETEDAFLKSDKSFIRRNTRRSFPRPEAEGSASEPREKMVTIEEMQEIGVRCDASAFYNTALPYDDVMRVGEDLWNESATPNDAMVTMREYLKTQFAFSRCCDLALASSVCKEFWDGRTSKRYDWNAVGIAACDANTSSEPKTLGDVAKTLLHARPVFYEP